MSSTTQLWKPIATAKLLQKALITLPSAFYIPNARERPCDAVPAVQVVLTPACKGPGFLCIKTQHALGDANKTSAKRGRASRAFGTR